MLRYLLSRPGPRLTWFFLSATCGAGVVTGNSVPQSEVLRNVHGAGLFDLVLGAFPCSDVYIGKVVVNGVNRT